MSAAQTRVSDGAHAMGEQFETNAAAGLASLGNGVWDAPHARIIDRTGNKRLPIGRDGYVPAMRESVVVDKTMLIADIIESGYAVTLFCRPRRFGKTLNMTMLKAFFELPGSDISMPDTAPLFEGTRVWEAEGGKYRAYQGAFPVVHISFNTVKKLDWPAALAAMRSAVAQEYISHDCLRESPALTEDDRAYFKRVAAMEAAPGEFVDSLTRLCSMLHRHHGRPAVLLVDEYDAPVMAGYTNGYYREVVDFLKGWLTGTLKDGGASLAFACLTGVQRITKESIFSDLNNLTVSTPLTVRFEERYGFTDDEVAALASYLGCGGCMDEARAWYDGYRFGQVDVYNPWSVLNYLDNDCAADVYWGNTSSNGVVGEAVRRAGEATLAKLYALLRPGGTVAAPLELGCVFPDVGVREGALWSMLYLAGYLTTDLTMTPNNNRLRRPLRIPNREVSMLFRSEVIERFTQEAGGDDNLVALHEALVAGDARGFEEAFGEILRTAPSVRDLVSENSVHMLLTGLLFGVTAYANPVSNREAGRGYYDLRLEPLDLAPGDPEAYYAAEVRPLITVEVKFLKGADAAAEPDALHGKLAALADEALAQIAERGYDEVPLPAGAQGRLRWGVAVGGRQAAVACAWK